MATWTPGWDAPRPYLHPVRTPAGALVTTEAPADHPWHHALWFTIKFVNGENFWEEYDEFGLLQTREVVDLDGGGVRATIEWERPAGRGTALTETRTLTPVDLGDDAYGIDWEEELVPVADSVFDRTPFTTWGGYGGLTLRGGPGGGAPGGAPGRAPPRPPAPRRAPPRPAPRGARAVVRAPGRRRGLGR